MSPVEPNPVVIGTTALPSRARADALCFLPKRAAFSSEGANMPPVSVPNAARKERRFQPNFNFMPIPPLPLAPKQSFIGRRCRRPDDQRAAYDFNQRISRNPFHGHARARRRFAL